MAKKSAQPPQDEMPANVKPDGLASRGLISKSVVATLGNPPNLYRVVVFPLWEGFFRVNVLIGEDSLNSRIAHSYFVEAGDDGAIKQSTPKLIKVY